MIKKLLLIFLITFFLASNCFADTIATSNTTGGGVGHAFYGGEGAQNNEQISQGFQVSENITCTKVEIQTYKTGTPTDNAILTIETNNGGVPSGTLVHANATKTLAMSSVINNGYTAFIFDNTFSLTANTTYVIRVKRSGAFDSSNYAYGEEGTGGGYAGGFTSVMNNGVWYKMDPSEAHDMYFKLYKQDAVAVTGQIIWHH